MTVDWCHDLDEDTGTSAGCYVSADTLGDSRFDSNSGGFSHAQLSDFKCTLNAAAVRFSSLPGSLRSIVLFSGLSLLLHNMSMFNAQSCRRFREKRWTDGHTHTHTHTHVAQSKKTIPLRLSRVVVKNHAHAQPPTQRLRYSTSLEEYASRFGLKQVVLSCINQVVEMWVNRFQVKTNSFYH